MKAQTTAIVIAVIVGLIVGIGIGYVAKSPGQAQTVTQTVTQTVSGQAQTVTQTVTKTVQQQASGLPKVIKIGALFPLTGDLSMFGENNQAALKLAEQDINDFLSKAGLPYQVKFFIEDTETKPDVALQKLQTLYSRGIKFVIGPMASASVRNLKGYADSNNIIVFSPSSTSTALSIPGDNIFRLVTDDNFQGKVIAGLAKAAGLEHVVIVWRGDDWGDGLRDATAKSLQKLGIEEVDGPRYSPEAKDFSAEVSKLANIVKGLVDKYGADKVGVVLICFQEGTQFMIQASQYDVLGSVRWFGSDGMAKATPLISDPTAAAFAEKVHFEAPIAALNENPKTQALKKRFLQELGREPETYAYNTYDIAWILTFSILMAHDYNPAKVKPLIPVVADNFFGVTGWTKLNEAGDRAFANYFIWTVSSQAGEYKWTLVGIYDTTTNTLIKK